MKRPAAYAMRGGAINRRLLKIYREAPAVRASFDHAAAEAFDRHRMTRAHAEVANDRLVRARLLRPLSDGSYAVTDAPVTRPNNPHHIGLTFYSMDFTGHHDLRETNYWKPMWKGAESATS